MIITGLPVSMRSSCVPHRHALQLQLLRPIVQSPSRRAVALRRRSKAFCPVSAVNKDESQLTVQTPGATLKRLQTRFLGGQSGEAMWHHAAWVPAGPKNHRALQETAVCVLDLQSLQQTQRQRTTALLTTSWWSGCVLLCHSYALLIEPPFQWP